MTDKTGKQLPGFGSAGYGLIQGLGLTFKHLFRPKVTLLYPEQHPDLPEGFRGIPVLTTDPETGELKCTGCGACARACPPKVIHMETSKSETGSNKRDIHDYSIDMTRCMLCNLCVEACPFEALAMSNHFEMAKLDAADLVFSKDQLVELFHQTHSAMVKPGHAWQPVVHKETLQSDVNAHH